MADLKPAEQDLEIVQGESFSAIFHLYADTAQTIPFNATGADIDIEIREGVADSGAPVILAATTRLTGDGAGKIRWLSYASDNSVDMEGDGDPGDGVFLLELTPADTIKLTPSKKPRKGAHASASFIYDAEIAWSSGESKRVMQGTITVDLEVTRRS